MAQNTAPAQAASPLKRRNPPSSQERPSAAVKRTSTTKIYADAPPRELHPDTMATLQEPGFSDGDGVEQDEEVSDDDQVEENGKSRDEIEMDSNKTNSDDEEGHHQSREVAGSMEPPRRQAKFPGFNKAMELVLLKGLNAVKPFAARYGETTDAWARVVQYLKDDDGQERAKGNEARFDLVNARNCKERWLVLSAEYATVATKGLWKNGTHPTVDARFIELQKAYLCERKCRDTKKAKKSRRYHAQAQPVLNGTNGDHLLAASWTGPLRERIVEEQESAWDQHTYEDPPRQFSVGFLSGTESDTSQSTNTRSRHRPPRTPGAKEQVLTVKVMDQLALAAEAIRGQLEHNNQQLAFLMEERVERRMAEEACIQRELELQARQQDAIAKLIEAQIASNERIAKQRNETSERIAKQQNETLERIAKLQNETSERLLQVIAHLTKIK